MKRYSVILLIMMCSFGMKGYSEDFTGGTIIGKVFEDKNGNGIQDIQKIDNIKVSIIKREGYIENVTKDKGIRVEEIENQLIIEKKILNEGKGKLIIEIISKDDEWNEFAIELDEENKIKVDSKGTLEVVKGNRGLNEIKLTRRIYKGDGYFKKEIEIVVMPQYEYGIPGIRVFTPQGIVAETDRNGQYHIPLDRGSNFLGRSVLVKLDTTSLPIGMKVMSENPKHKKITFGSLTKINFSIQ